jgi:hypothetical protein
MAQPPYPDNMDRLSADQAAGGQNARTLEIGASRA